MLDWLDIISRFGAATAIGAPIGLYFELHQKPTGVRTLGLVALASAAAVLAVAKKPDADASRIIQGVITGVGWSTAWRLRRQFGLLHPWASYAVSVIGASWPSRSSLPSSC
jgi:hypothetical protein